MNLSENLHKNSEALINLDGLENLEFELNEKLKFNLAVGNDFKIFREQNSLYIDKSLFIQEIIDNKCGVNSLLITRPRRWGKSLNLSMLKYFFGIEVDENGTKLDQNPNKYLFNDLKISQAKIIIKDAFKNTEKEVSIMDNYQGKYPVILLCLKDIEGDNLLKVKHYIGKQILDVYEEHIYLLKSPSLEESYKKNFKERLEILNRFNKIIINDSFLKECDLKDSLKFLTKILYKHHKEKSYILIDEYDFTVNKLLSKYVKIILEKSEKNEEIIETIKDTIYLINSIISLCSKSHGNFTPEKVILIGINDILVKEGSSGVNNIKTISLHDDSFCEYFGVYEEEIKEQYLDKMFTTNNPFLKTQFMNTIKEWYNGYYNGSNDKKIYNVWSVVNYLSDFYIKYEKERKALPKMGKKSRLSLKGKHQPKNYWLKTGDNDIIEKFINFNIDESLWEKLKNLSLGNSDDLIFDENFNLYIYLKNKDTYFIEQPVTYLLYSFGYITQTDKKGEYKIPNNEVKEYFKKYVSKAWVSKILDVSDQIPSNFSRELSINLGDHLKFLSILQSHLLPILSKGEKTEAYFEKLIGGIIEFHYLWNKGTALYYTIVEKTVKYGRIDNIFFPNQESHNKSETIIHEYKMLNKTNMDNVKTASNDALWQIYCKNYISEPLSKYEFIQVKENWKVKIRTIIFHKNENDSTWSVSVDSYEFNYSEAQKIHSFFNNISSDERKIMSNSSPVN